MTLLAKPFSLVDMEAREVHYLRLSVTDRCNYRCTYCMPAAGVDVVPRMDLLTFDEIERLVRVFVGLGVRKVRLTGGEPLVRRNVVTLVGRLAAIAGVEDLAMTTNGHLLPTLAAPLRAAGLGRLNVSLDSLDYHRFERLSRHAGLAEVLRGLEAAGAAGFTGIKLNTVVLRGENDVELADIAGFAAAHGHVARFIESMPIGAAAQLAPQRFVSAMEVRARLAETHDLAPDLLHDHPGGGPARYWLARPRAGGPAACIGFISAVSERFCKLCNRVRLSSTGTLRECLSLPGELSLRDMLRAGASDDAISAAMGAALHTKVAGHEFDAAGAVTENMNAIGG